MWGLRESAHPVLTDEGGSILDERTGRWTELTPTAAAAVMLLLSCSTKEQAADRLAERYGIPSGQAAADVRTVADALAAKGLVPTENAPSPRHRRRWWP
ncbi:PqqD family peptide modification chaperone [Streptomyces yunnanensis]|uniref:Coenzyme PQQ synthesis protein D (PqqD) n=1 Tax=Streptomyces yunnanensis TaxID=156453 RepID=A0A9X8N8Z6_9ACTN|nr:PqqD family peptide modification chaperone [Streptomyces yunnanensis]SHN31010.1 Coenzyme PQQ synthesis protein D (PqqD) [Streptomyces yunnanensis]